MERLRKHWITFFVMAISISITLITLIPLNTYKRKLEFKGNTAVKLRIKFEGCACGLDYPQYVVDSVFYTEIDKDGYYNKNVYLETTLKKHENLLEMNQASGCYYWVITGKMQNNEYGMHQVVIEDIERFVHQNCAQ
jgi:hypothetical protein